MQTADRCLSINPAKVVSENFDGECVVIDFGTGNYYSLRGSAPVLWERLQSGVRQGDIGNWAESCFQDSTEALKASEELIEKFIAEGLVEVSDANDLPNTGEPENAEQKHVYEPMLFERYDDMAEMIGMDPIHDVDENAGWPNKK